MLLRLLHQVGINPERDVAHVQRIAPRRDVPNFLEVIKKIFDPILVGVLSALSGSTPGLK